MLASPHGSHGARFRGRSRCALTVPGVCLHGARQAAARLGVTVIASGPLAEGALLRNETLKARPSCAALPATTLARQPCATMWWRP